MDVFVIATGGSRRQVQSLAESVEEQLKGAGRAPLRIEGKTDADWMLIDYGEVVVHLFQQEPREFYSLERLWGDATPIEWAPSTADLVESTD